MRPRRCVVVVVVVVENVVCPHATFPTRQAPSALDAPDCTSVLLRLPPRPAGCFPAESLTLQQRRAPTDAEPDPTWTTVREGLAPPPPSSPLGPPSSSSACTDCTALLTALDAYVAYEYRLLAINSLGSTAGGGRETQTHTNALNSLGAAAGWSTMQPAAHRGQELSGQAPLHATLFSSSAATQALTVVLETDPGEGTCRLPPCLHA